MTATTNPMDAFLANLAEEISTQVAAKLAETLPAPDRLLGIEQVSEMLDVSDRTIRNLTAKGELGYVKVAGAVKFERAEVERYVASRRQSRR